MKNKMFTYVRYLNKHFKGLKIFSIFLYVYNVNYFKIQGVKNNVYNVSGMIEGVKTNTFLFDKTLAYAPFCR